MFQNTMGAQSKAGVCQNYVNCLRNTTPIGDTDSCIFLKLKDLVQECAANRTFCLLFQKNFQDVHSGPIRCITKQIFKIWIFYSRNFHFKLGF